MSLRSTAALLLVSAPLFAQSYQGGIRGAISDSTGAGVAQVPVMIVDQGTNVSRATVSNATGEYVFSAVTPATYTLVAEVSGFKKFERKNIVVNTQEFLTVDVKLELGQTSESVIVTEEVPLIETANASTGQVLDRQKLADLPNTGRSPYVLAFLVPGVVPGTPPGPDSLSGTWNAIHRHLD